MGEEEEEGVEVVKAAEEMKRIGKKEIWKDDHDNESEDDEKKEKEQK